MCIVFWTLAHPDYALIMCTNRDEYLTRPTQDADFHDLDHDKAGERGPTSGSILSGIDMKAGGTWLGLNRAGKVAALTNITEPYQTWASSRGTLVSSFLSSDSTKPLEDQVAEIAPRDAKFAGFNLLLLAPHRDSTIGSLKFDASFVSNNGGGGILTCRKVSSEDSWCTAFSNAAEAQGGADWPKVTHGKSIFASILERKHDEKDLMDRLFLLLAEQSPELVDKRSELCRTIRVVPFSVPSTAPEMDRVYGTRLSTVILIGRDGSVLFIERDVWKYVEGQVTYMNPPTERIYRFHLEI